MLKTDKQILLTISHKDSQVQSLAPDSKNIQLQFLKCCCLQGDSLYKHIITQATAICYATFIHLKIPKILDTAPLTRWRFANTFMGTKYISKGTSNNPNWSLVIIYESLVVRNVDIQCEYLFSMHVRFIIRKLSYPRGPQNVCQRLISAVEYG